MTLAGGIIGAGTRVERLAVYGGTFDPVHCGHVAIAQAALDAGAADRVLFMPVGQQPLKPGRAHAPGEVRVAMLAAAIASEPRFAVSRLELERPGPHYTIDTLRQLRQLEPEVEIAFLCGADQLASLPRWHEPLALLAEFTLLVAARPGQRPVAEIIADLGAAGFPQELLARVTALPAPLLDISATDIRARVRRGEPLDGLVPPAVAALIAQHGLYTTMP